MCAHVENAETGPKGDQGTLGLPWSESSMCPVSLRRRHPRVLEDGGAGGPAAPTKTRRRQLYAAGARWPDRRRRSSEGGSADRLAREGPAGARQVRRRLVGPGQGDLDLEARRSRAFGPAAPGRRCRWLDLVAWCPDIETSGVSTCRYQIAICRHWCLYLETACRSEKGSAPSLRLA